MVSLVPSLTESLFDLGAGASVVGVTDYCVYPRDALLGMKRVGGTRTPNLSDILQLEPDLVFANREENSHAAVERLLQAGIPVHLSFPKTIRESLDDLNLLVRLFQSHTAYIRLETLERAVEWAEADLENRPSRSYFCPVWKHQESGARSWWMTFNRQTYGNDLLRLLGGENVFSERERHYPISADLQDLKGTPQEGRDTRYPRVPMEEILDRAPEYILLPDEPYPFAEEDQEAFSQSIKLDSTGRIPKIQRVDGSLIFWHGTRLGLALTELGNLFS